METTEQAVPETVTTVQDTPPTTEVQTDTSSAAPVETIAAPEEVRLDPIKPFELPKASVPDEDFTPTRVVEKFKGKEKELFEAVAIANGLNDFQRQYLPTIKDKDTLIGIADAIRTDWTQVSLERKLEMKLKEDYSQIGGLSEEKINRLVQSDMRNIYGIGVEHDDPESEEVIKAEYKSIRDAHDFTQRKIAQQQEILQNLSQFQPQQEQPITVDPVQVMEQQRQQIIADGRVKQILQSKIVPLGEFNYQLQDPAQTMANIYDPNRWSYMVSQKAEDGSVVTDPQTGQPLPNYELLMQVSAFVENPKAFISALIEHGKTQGKKQLIDERENVQDTKTFGAAQDTDDLETRVAKAIQARQNNR